MFIYQVAQPELSKSGIKKKEKKKKQKKRDHMSNVFFSPHFFFLRFAYVVLPLRVLRTVISTARGREQSLFCPIRE